GARGFGVDDDTMEAVVLDLLRKRGLTLGLAESITGGLVASRLVSVPGTSDVLKGSVVAYMTDAKRAVLGVTAEHVVSSESARQLAAAARRGVRGRGRPGAGAGGGPGGAGRAGGRHGVLGVRGRRRAGRGRRYPVARSA